MRKFLLSTIALLMTISVMAVGSGDGSSKANAIDFDWTNGHEHVGTKCYRVDLSEIDGLVDPTLALYLTNLTDESVMVTVEEVSATVSVSFAGTTIEREETRDGGSYSIAPRDYKLWSQNVTELLKMNARYLYLKLSAPSKIALSAKKYETSEIVDLACEKAVDFNWNGETVAASEEGKWYRLNLAEIKAQNKKLDFVVANQGSKKANVKFDLSLDCPASVVFGYNWTIPAGGEMTEEFGRIFIDELKEDYVYLKLTTDANLVLKVKEEVVPVVPDVTWTVNDILKEGKSYTFSGKHVFEVAMSTLSAPRGMRAEFVVTNNNGAEVTLKKQISFANPVKSTIDKELKVAANSTVTKEVVNNMAGVINSNKAYICFDASAEVTVQLNYVVENEEIMNAKPVEISTCENSQLLKWNSTVKQSGLETKWYEIDLTSMQQNGQHLQLSFTNNSKNIVVVMGEILPACGSESIPYVLPLQAGESINQLINYNLFALMRYPKHFKMSATVVPTTAKSIMEFKDVRSKEDIMKFVPQDIDVITSTEVSLRANTVSASVDPTDCSKAVTITRGVKYEQAAGETRWYRVTDDLVNKVSLFPDIAFINNGKSAANVTIAAGVSCEYSTFGMSTIAVPTWADLTVFPSNLIGKLLDKALNPDVTEMYIQVTSDQPIAFGIDIDYGFGLGCDDARVFDWEKGATIKASDAQWLSFDITSVKKNKQEVKLTLTNESNSLAWVGMMVSLTCPFDVALPTFFAIPAGMSIDKVVDYSYFASTRLDQLYVALITEENISVKAEAVKSESSASDKLACQNAVEVKNGEAYVHKPGTTWYKFNRAMFSDVSRLPKFRYAAEATTNVTFGATVGCEYNIATHANIKFPSTRGLEVSFRTPGFITEILDKFVHPDVKEFYVELKTDKQIKFGMDMEYAGGCEKATKLDFSKPIDIDLKAGKDVWYTINLKDFEKLGDKLITFNLNNPADKAVEVEFELTPTCPLIVSAIKSVSVPAGVNMPLAFPASKVADLYDQVIAQFNLPERIENNLPAQLHEYYVRIRANGDLSIDEGEDAPEVIEPGCSEATPLDITQPIDVEKLSKGWYVVDMTKIKKDFTLKFVNTSGSNQTLDFDFYKGCDESIEVMQQNWLTSYNFVVPTTGLEQKVPYSMISSLITMDELYIYLNKEEGGEVDMACAEAMLINPAEPFSITLKEGEEQWFKVATNAFDNFDKNLAVSFENPNAKDVKVDFSLATTCPALMTIDSTVTVKASYNRVDSITAGMIELGLEEFGDKLNSIDTAYIRVLANGTLNLTVDTFTVVVPDVPEGCENAKELDFSKTINLSDIKTGWYHVDLRPIKNGSVKNVSINNDLGKEMGVKFDIFRNCEQSSFLYTYTHAFEVGLFEQSIPSSALSMLGSLNELYIYITMDVDILTCEDAIEFDWSKGAVLKADTTQWYHFDITSVENNEQQVKLTFTNHSDKLAVVYGEVAMHCPYKYSIPYACVVPGGMSIDKVVDYSIFKASRVEELYVKVHSTETIELGATTESALVFDQTPCNNATLVESGKEYRQSAGTSWYKLPKSLFMNTGKLPKFYFTTEADGLTKITLGATVGCEYNIATKTIVMLPGSLNYAMVMPEQMFDLMDKFVSDDVTEVYVEMTTDRAVHFSVDMVNNTDDACHGAELLDVTKGIDLKANEGKWYKIDLDALKAMNSDVAVKVINPSAKSVKVDMEMSLTCPVVVSLNRTLTLPGVAEMTRVFSQSTIAKIPGVSFYVRFAATEDVQIVFGKPELPEDQESCEDAKLLDWTQTINLSELTTGWYKFDLTQLHAAKSDFTLKLNNDLGRATYLGLELYKDCESARLVNLGDSVSEGLHVKSVSYDMLYMMIGAAPELYAYITIDGAPVPPTPAEGCETATDYVLGTTITVEANSDVWYKINLAELKASGKGLDIKIKNVDVVKADITASLAFECPGTIAQTLNYSIEAGDSLAATIPYSYYKDIESDVLYLNLKTTAKLEITVGESSVVVPDVPEGCENAKDLDFSKTINLSTIQTGWYRVDLTPLKNGSVTKLSINNDLGKETGVKFDIFRNCEQSSFLYTYTHAFKPGMFEQSIPSSMVSMLGSATELYIYITMDVDILTCEDAIEFDWSKGAIHQDGDTQWYHFDITSVENNEQQVKLTFTNHSDKLAVVYGEVAMHCPYKYSIPYACVVSGGMSIDKVVDYSVFKASRVEELYVKVHSTETIELGATTESALVFDQTPCNNATLVESGVEYRQSAGTSWYRLPKSLFVKNTGKLPKFYFTTEEEGLTKITLGATVGCEYNIATKTIFVLPGSLNYAMVTPEQMFDLMDKFVSDDVTEVYVEMTTDRAVHFSVDMINNTDDACHGAEVLNATDGIKLEANQDKWYKVDFDAIQAMNSDVAVTIVNPSAEAVTVDMELSPTCPVVISLNKSLVLPAAQEVTKVFSQSTLAKIPGVPFYVRFRATADVEILFSEPETPEDEQACQDATLLDWTSTINLSEIETGWYKFDLTQLHANPGNFTLSLNNDLGYATYLGLELYQTCETGRLINLGDSVGEGLHVKSVTYSELTTLVGTASDVYAYITIGGKPEPPILVEGCETAEPYVWNTDVKLNAGDAKWYKLPLVDLRGKICDLTLTANNASVDTVRAVVDLYSGCPVSEDNSIISMTVAINPNTMMTQTVSSDKLPMDVDTIYLHVEAAGEMTVNMRAECLEYAYDTISSYACVDAQQMWNDTVHVSATLDSVYTYIVNPFEAPVVMTDAILATISGATPELKQGATPDMTASADAIEAYYQTQDTETIADVVNVTWNTTKVGCDATSYAITLVVEDNCGRKQETTHTFNDIVVRPAGVEEFATICYGEKYVWQSRDYTATGVYNDTLKDVNGCDSVNVLHLTVLPAVKEIVENEVICHNETYTWDKNGNNYNKTTTVEKVILNSLGCDSIRYVLNLTVQPAAVYAQVEKRTICFGEYVEWRGASYGRTGVYEVAEQNVNGCDSIIYTLDLTVAPDVVYMPEEHAVICQGSTFTWNKNGGTYDADGVYTYIEKGKSGCDSVVYYLNLDVVSDGMQLAKTICHGKSHTIQTNGQEYTYSQSGIYKISLPSGCEFTFVLDVLPAVPMTYVDTVVCGTSFEWNHEVFTASGSYERIFKTAVHGCDSVVTLKLTLKQPAVSEQTIAACDSYEWNGNTYTVSGDYTFITTAANGCDSTATLHLTINKSEVKTDTVSACDSYTWNGQTYTQSGTYTYNTTTATGCGRVETLVLTIKKSVTASETVTACGSYAWNGQTYTQSGDYTFTTIAANGCDSTVTLHLTVNQPATAELSEIACESYTWGANGQTYTQSGDYTFTTIAANGCDSVVTLHLTVNQPVSSEFNATSCGSYAWNGQTYTHSGNYQQTFVAANGCDSVVILHLTINEIVYKEFTETRCDSYTWNGQVYSATGDYTQTFQAANGCDSIVTLHLHIVQAGTNTDTTVTICENELPYIWNGQELTNGGTYTHPLSECNATVTLHLIVNQSVTTEFSATACGSYTWNSFTYATSGDYIQTFQAANGCDSTVTLHLTINQPVVAEFSATACGSYTWNSATYGTSGDYVQKFTAANGCDSTVTLHLTINQPVTAEFSATACGSYTWNGQTYTQSGNYQQTLQTANGCDSVVTLHLTINQSATAELSEIACESYTWGANGQTYTQSGDYTFTTTAANGCDSVVTLHLIINQPVASEFNATACGSYDWNSTTYTQSGDYKQIFTVANGCDSTVTLHLTVNKSVTKDVYETACGSYDWNGQTYTQSGNYQQTFVAANGCDSVVTLHLTINEVANNSFTMSVCDSYTWNGQVYSATGDYTQTFQAANGCDSIVTLHLHIVQAGTNTDTTVTICENELPYIWNGQRLTNGGTYTHPLSECNATVTLHLIVLPKVTETIQIESCGSYTWNSATYATSGDYTQTFTAANGCDSVVTLHLTVNQPVSYEFAATACGSYTWNSATYATSGDYQQTFAAANGCDSVVTLHLTINQPVASELNETACVSYTWTNGQTYTASGDYVQTLTAANGCDSTVTLHLIINQPVASEFNATACGSYDWNNTTYTQSGDHQQIFTAVNGCDSVVTLHLTVNQPVASEFDATACGSYTWNGQTYIHSGNYQQTFVAANGCDSVVTLHLTINEIVYKEFTESRCVSYTWNGQVYSATGDYTQTFQAANGCDSIVTLHLQIVQAGTNTDTTVTICENELPYIWNGQELTNGGTYTHPLPECNATVTLHLIVLPKVTETIQIESCDSYTWNGQTYTQSGDYQQTFTAVNGCDSVVTLHLTINQPVTAEFSATACGSYTWNSATYATSGDYQQTFAAANGCDSTVTLHLTVNQPVASELNETACVSYTWTNGQTYTASGDYVQTLTAANGCDSTVTLHLTILPPVKDSVEFMTICYGEVYDWNGMKCSAPTDYVYTIKNSLNCDSIRITLHLSVRNEVLVITETKPICFGDSYEWGGVIYSSDTVVTKTLDNIYGCDSIVTFKLIVHDEILPTFENVDIYEGESYVWVDTTLTTAGTYTKTFPSELTGCDSVVNLILNVLPKSTVKVPVTGLVCDGTEYVDPITKEAHIISSLIPSTWTWTTTVAGVTADTIYQFEVTPIVAPALLDSATLVTIPSAVPILVQGEKPQVDIDAIRDYYKSVDNDIISDVDTIIWSNVDTLLACDALTHEMTLTVMDMCDNVMTMPFTFAVQLRNVKEELTVETICYGETYSWYDNNGNFIKDCSEGRQYRDTIRTSFGCDSIVRVLDLTVRPIPTSIVTDTTICFDDLPYFVWDVEPYMVFDKDTVVSVIRPDAFGCDGIIELRLNVLPAAKVVTTDTVICAGETITWIDGVVYNATTQGKVYTAQYAGTTCDSIIATLNLRVLPATTVVTTDTVICAGETITWIDGVVYNATTQGKVYTAQYAGTTCDSVIGTLNLRVLPAATIVTTDTVICAGETITWIDGVVYNATTQGEVYRAQYAGTICDSIIGTLNLTVLPAATIVTTDTVICAGETITWIDGVVYNATTIGKAYTAKYAGTTCDSVIGTLNLTVLPAATIVTTDTVICAGETITWIDGVVYNATTIGKVYTAQYAGTTCDSIIGTLNLTVLPAATVVTTDTVICAGETITWIDGVVYNATTIGKAYTAKYAGTTCDSIIATLNLTVKPAAKVVTTDTVICAGETITWIDGVVYNATTIGKVYTAQYAGTICDSVIGTLNLKVLPAATVVTTDTVICAGETITWIDGVVYNATTQGKVYTAQYAGTICDSIIATLNLTVLPETVTENEKLIICESEFPYSWRGQTLTTIGTYNAVDKFVGHDCDSVIYVLELQTYVMTLPDNVTMPIAVCGNPVDVADATADIEGHIASTDLYAPNAEVTWYVYNNGTWTIMDSNPIKGGVTDVTVKYVITSDCDTIESDELVVTVEAPTPENDVDMDNVLIVSKYENRIFLLHLKDFETRFNWVPTPEEVTWYKVVNEIDIIGVDGPEGDDIFVGTGHAYNEPNGSTIKPGDYYAVIIRNTVEHPDDCHTTMKSVILSSGVVAMIPELVSNVVGPDENLKLINLSSEEITEVYVYNMTGELIETYVVEKDSEFIFNAAHVSGYYLIDVKTANAKTTLRYIVK